MIAKLFTRKWGFLQTSQGQNPNDTNLLPRAHVQFPDLRNRDKQHEDIIDHVDDTKCKEERGNVDASSGITLEPAPKV